MKVKSRKIKNIYIYIYQRVYLYLKNLFSSKHVQKHTKINILSRLSVPIMLAKTISQIFSFKFFFTVSLLCSTL